MYFNFVFSVPLGSIPELPAETCKEIKASEGQAVSKKYWLSTIKPGISVLAHCDMNTDGGCVSLVIYDWSLTSRNVHLNFQFSYPINNCGSFTMCVKGQWLPMLVHCLVMLVTLHVFVSIEAQKYHFKFVTKDYTTLKLFTVFYCHG